jgi:TPR repeat protein
MRPLITLLCLVVAPVLAQDNRNDIDVFPPTDLAVSLNEWREMAEQGQAIAQYYLGIGYEYGRGVRQSDGEAVKWYRKASAQGLPAAQYRLGVLYDNGWGVPVSDAEAVKWYRRAAEQGHTYAQYDLAMMYVAGTGVGQDYVQAYMWLNIAIASGNRLLAKHLDSLSEKMSAAQITKARKMAREWMKKHRRLSKRDSA